MVAPSRSLSARAHAALLTGRLLGTLSRRLGRGGGTALPGMAAGIVNRTLTGRLAAQLGAGLILVTGTNGKTTTARLLAGIAAAAGRRPVHNRTGSNLMRGIGTTLLEAASLDGRIRGASRRLGVFEVDEATLPHAVAALRPDSVIFTNLFRDQLDRYGEVDSILSLWQRSLSLLPAGATLVLNADDPSVAGLGEAYPGPLLYYGVNLDEQSTARTSAVEHAADARWCTACDGEYVYEPIYYGHVGLWHCPGCGRRRPQPQIVATGVRSDGGSVRLAIEDGGAVYPTEVALEGLYNAYNVLAAFAGAHALGIKPPDALRGLSTFTPAFGRQESAQLWGRELRLLLCKNPAGTNQVLATLLEQPEPLNLLVALNDGIQDGRDISWIWDVDFERLAGRVARVQATGSRASDIALRLKYAGLDGLIAVDPRPAAALQSALKATPVGQRLSILPTYTAMMGLRETIARHSGKQQFWRQ